MAFPPGTKGGVRVPYVELIPQSADDVPNGSLYLDTDNGDAASVKGTGGGDEPIGAASSTSFKSKRNTSGSTIDAGSPVALKTDGGIVLADSDAAGTQILIGIATEDILDTAFGSVAIIGPNVDGCIDGLGFAPGDAIYLNEIGGYTNDLNDLVGGNDSIIRIGYADCANGECTTDAIDLILFAEVLARPEP